MVRFERTGKTARNKRIRFCNDCCDGSPNCAGELHIEATDYRNEATDYRNSGEIHLTYVELRSLRNALTRALDEWEQGVWR